MAQEDDESTSNQARPPMLGKLFLVSVGLEKYDEAELAWMVANPVAGQMQDNFAEWATRLKLKEQFSDQDLRQIADSDVWKPWQNRLDELIRRYCENPFDSPFQAQMVEGIRRLAAQVRRDHISRN